ncbi:uncharacterized protein LOC126732716 isoform X2 [Quercus robur]|uniref:uncharacterized protein LOC126732716 isoform X2 n=1 Tax=Quercus robur TaxID=38942 RepID=UPI0021638587|nr:uncharacterized protein LOC126732716 isoform X2 [Quercus robur]
MATTTDRRYRWPPLRFSHNHRHFSGNITSTKQCKKASLYCNMDYLLHLLDSSDTQLDLMLLELSACLAVIVSFVPWVRTNYAMISLLITRQKELFLMEKLGCSSAVVRC